MDYKECFKILSDGAFYAPISILQLLRRAL